VAERWRRDAKELCDAPGGVELLGMIGYVYCQASDLLPGVYCHGYVYCQASVRACSLVGRVHDT
jgi:hypothetical protein